jgi:hypothetical protein
MLTTSTRFNYDLILLMVGATDLLDAALAAWETVCQFERLLLDYVGGLLSKMDNRAFLLSCSGGSGNGEVGDGGEDSGGVEQGLAVAGGRDPQRQGVRRVAVLVVVLINDGDRCR